MSNRAPVHLPFGSTIVPTPHSKNFKRKSTYFSTTGCFIVAIFVMTALLLLKMHYSVQISSFFSKSEHEFQPNYKGGSSRGRHFSNIVPSPSKQDQGSHHNVLEDGKKNRLHHLLNEFPGSVAVHNYHLAGNGNAIQQHRHSLNGKGNGYTRSSSIDDIVSVHSDHSKDTNQYNGKGNLEENPQSEGRQPIIQDSNGSHGNSNTQFGTDADRHSIESSDRGIATTTSVEEKQKPKRKKRPKIVHPTAAPVSDVHSNTVAATAAGETTSTGKKGSGGKDLKKATDDGARTGTDTSTNRKNKKMKEKKLKEKKGSKIINSGKKEKNQKPKEKKKKKKPKKRDPYDFVVNVDANWGVAGEWDLKYIQVMPTKKMLIKKDRRVVFPNITITNRGRLAAQRQAAVNASTDDAQAAAGVNGSVAIPGFPKALLEANDALARHPLRLFRNQQSTSSASQAEESLEDVMTLIYNSSFCRARHQPVYLTMATVGDDLYWQLIENFVYTLVKFEVSQCALVICVSDTKCMKMCESSLFPCYNYVSDEKPLPSVMEQIAQVKLLHVPKVLNQGVDVFMLDLDVGFLEDPAYMIQVFTETPIVDIFVQEDYIFIMNRTKAGWKSWFTEPLPNIGLFLCRGNNRTARVFEHAWSKYLKMDSHFEKSMPGRDQNHVLDSMRIGRANYGLKYAYFGPDTAPLLDKLVYRHGGHMELGGEAISSVLEEQKAVAMHTTCYEKSTKVMGLKASNAFWNPRYYDSQRRTLTKQILYVNDAQLLDEVRSLVWLAMTTGRSLVLPNILGHERRLEKPKQGRLWGAGGFPYRGQVMWPGFRVTYLKRNKGHNALKVTILEPAYYWRVNRDYDAIPDPKIAYFSSKDNLIDIKNQINGDDPRIIIHAQNTHHTKKYDRWRVEQELAMWANDSVGIFARPYSKMQPGYHPIPSVKGIRYEKGVKLVEDVLQNMRNCKNVFGAAMGNRTCFQICD